MTAQARPDELIRILRAEFVTKGGGVPGGLCVVFSCGATGWRATGGTTPRTLIHETAFQLDAGGNARGTAAIDLQTTRSNANEVAEGDYSIILGGEDNRITDSTGGTSSEYSIVGGDFNYLDDAYACQALGGSNQIYNDSYSIFVSGRSHDIDIAFYGTYLGFDHTVVGAFGCFALNEANSLIENVNDYPTYSGAAGIINELEGDIYLTFQFGESQKALGDGTPGEIVLWSAQYGFENYLEHVVCNYQFGQGLKSHRPTYDGFYDGRLMWNGDYPNKNPSDGTGFIGGLNQDSLFGQSDLITDWAAAWTTSRFEFPIIQDSIWGFLAYITGTEQGCANSYMWKIEGLVENDGGTTTILASTVTNIYRDVATKEWQVAADDANDRLIFQYRDTAGADGTDCNIQFNMLTTEVGFPA